MSLAARDGNRWRLVLAGCLLAAAFIAVRMDQGTTVDAGSLDELEDLHASVSAGSAARRAAYLALGVAGVLGLVLPGRTPLCPHGALAALGIAAVAWYSLSVFWSEDPGLSIRRVSVFLSVLVAALAAVKQFTWRQVLLLGLCASGVQLAASLAAAIAGGTLQPWHADYRFSGLLHPNHEAINCAVLALSAFFLARDSARAKVPLYLAALTALGVLLLTRSRTSLVAAVIGCTLSCWAMASRKARLLGLFAAVATACLALVFLGGWIPEGADRVIRLGRENADTLTLAGRIPLWEELLPYAWDRPLAGYGYNSFWTPPRIEALAASQGWAISHAHCDYLEVLLGAGVVGLALYVAVLAEGVRGATIRARSALESGGSGLPVWPWFAAIGGFTEGIGHQNYLFQFMLMAALAHVALHAGGPCVNPESPTSDHESRILNPEPRTLNPLLAAPPRQAV